MSTLTNIELRIDKLENKVRRLECQTCSSPLFYDTFEDFPTEGRNGFLYVDKETGGIYIWNGEYITLYEEKICLNETEFVPTDVNNPTTEEVKIWTDANLSEVQKNNGTVLTYYVGNLTTPPQQDINLYFPTDATLYLTGLVVNGDDLNPTGIPIAIVEEVDCIVSDEIPNLLSDYFDENNISCDITNNICVDGELVLTNIVGNVTINMTLLYDGELQESEYEFLETELTVIGDGGDCDHPDFVWTLNDSGKITLDYKRTFNTKTVYVDAGSGSDVTGKRGYRNFPFKTLNTALAAIQDGDTLYVFPGDYTSSVTVSKFFNIYCEDGVAWDMQTILLPKTGLNNTLYKLKWKFDRLYCSGTVLLWNDVKGINFLDIEINEFRNISMGLGVSEGNYKIKNFRNGAVVDINTWHRTDSTVVYPYVNLEIDTLYIASDSDRTYAPIRNATEDNSIVNIIIHKTLIDGNIGTTAGIINNGFPVINAGVKKSLVQNFENVTFYCDPAKMYVATPDPWYTTAVGVFHPATWWAGRTSIGNQVLWYRNGLTNSTNLNCEIANYRGTGHGIVMYGWHFDTPYTSPTLQRVINVKIQGYWEKGIPISLHWFGGLGCTNCPQNTIVNIDLDVICDTSMGVAFWCTGGIHESNRFNISGKIVTKYPGMPCITLSGIADTVGGNIQTNNTITLKDLLLINDGTVQPIMVNPLYTPQVQEVNIMNVKSNSLIVDTNVTEVGESIVRNINYK